MVRNIIISSYLYWFSFHSVAVKCLHINIQSRAYFKLHHAGTGGKSIYGNKFAVSLCQAASICCITCAAAKSLTHAVQDENFTLKHTKPGLLSMANAGALAFNWSCPAHVSFPVLVHVFCLNWMQGPTQMDLSSSLPLLLPLGWMGNTVSLIILHLDVRFPPYVHMTLQTLTFAVVFGEVTKGLEIVQAIEALGSQSGKTTKKIEITASGQL